MTYGRTHLLPVLIPLYLTASPLAFGINTGSIFPAGAESKAAGMESSLRSDGPPSILYNPANLSRGAGERYSQPYAEVGVVNVNYIYEHPDFDPVAVAVTSPTATIGYAHRINDKITFGGVLYPSNFARMEVPALPRKIGQNLQPVAVKAEDQVIESGVGAAFDVGGGVAMGLSMLGTYEEHRRKTSLPAQETPISDVEYSNVFFRPVLGIRYIPRAGLRTAFSVRPPLTKGYHGSQKESATSDETNPRVVDYEPASFNAGIGANIRPLTVNLEAQYQQWQSGENIYKNGANADAANADLKNTTQISTSMGYRFNHKHVISLGYAHLPTPWGEGRDQTASDPGIQGVDFGQLNGVTLDALTLGGRWKVADYDLSFSLSKAQGTREVRSIGEHSGFYSVDVNAVSGGIKRSF